MRLKYTIKFEGSIRRTFNFETQDYRSDLDDFITEKSDGYLYIQGCRITKNKEGIRTIYSNLSYNLRRDIEVGYVDSHFTVDPNGYVICTYHHYSSNQADRWMDKFMHRFG